LVKIANEPLGTPGTLSTPSIACISQSGRLRSRGRDSDTRDGVAQLFPVGGLRQPQVMDVGLQIEVLVLDPARVIEVQRHPHQPAPKDRPAVQPPLDVSDDVREPDGAARLAVDGS
jgi:hypothetical protein